MYHYYYPHPQEEQLIQQLSQGDNKAYSNLYNYHFLHLKRQLSIATTLSSQDQDDFIQEAFMKIWENRENLFLINSFKDYLFVMVRNMYTNMTRRQIKREEIYTRLSKDAEVVINNVEDQFLYDFYTEKTMRAIAALPQLRRHIFRLCYIEGTTRKEAAMILDISEVAVKKQLQKGKVFIINYLKRHVEWPVLLILSIF